MTLEETTAKMMKEQIEEDEKKLAELKKQILAKKLIANLIEKEAKRDAPVLPSKFFNNLKFKLTRVFARANDRAELALSNPDSYVAKDLEHEATELHKKCKKIFEDNKKAGKFALKAANMVMRLKAAVEQLELSSQVRQTLNELSLALDEQVQRLRSTPKAEHEKFEEAIEALKA